MTLWWANQLDYVYFVYGLAFLTMGTVLWGLHRHQNLPLPWHWLAFYGLIHGTNEWLDLLKLSFGDSPLQEIAKLILLAGSYLCLLEFARCGYKILFGKTFPRSILLLLLPLAALGGFHGPSGINATIRYALGLPGALSSAWLLFRFAQRDLPNRRHLLSLALFLGLYAFATGLIVPPNPFFPANWLNRDTFFALCGFPIQILRGGLGVALAIGFWWYGESLHDNSSPAENRSWKMRELLLTAFILLILITGWFITQWVGKSSFHDAQHRQLAYAQTIAAALPQEWLPPDSDPKPLDYPGSSLLQKQLHLFGRISPTPRIYHLLRLQDHKIIVLAQANSTYIPNDDDCPDLHSTIHNTFLTATPAIVGPHQNDDGLCLTSAVPILSPQGKILAVLTVDEDAHPILLAAKRARLMPIFASLLSTTLLIVLFTIRRNNSATQEKLRKLSRAVEQSPASIVITDTTGRIQYVNPKFSALTGYSPAEAFGQNPRILKGGSMPPENYQHLWDTITAGHEWHGEFLNRKKNGDIYWESASISPIFDDSGRITHYLAVKEDITDRKLVDARLQRSLSLLGATLESTADGILVTDPDGSITRINRKFAQLWSIPEEHIQHLDLALMSRFVNTQISNLTHYNARYREIINDPNCVSSDEINLNDGRVFERHSHPEILDGIVVGRVWSFRDITPVKKLLNEQRVNIDIARQLLRFVDLDLPRYVDLDPQRALFIEAVSLSCTASGGDHAFARVFASPDGLPQRTLISLKDQSGHEVNCTLRSIATDLLHHALLTELDGQDLAQQMKRLNNQLCNSGLNGEDDFLTAVTVELDHASRTLRFASCGHPPLILIRDSQVIFLPQDGQPGHSLPLGAISDAAYSVGEYPLLDGDRILLYTDGLIEMCVRNRGKRISQSELEAILSNIVASDAHMPISEIMRQLLQTVAHLSGETAFPGDPAHMTDDITLIGLEIQPETADHQILLQPPDLDAVSDEIDKLFTTIAPLWTQAGFPNAQHRLRLVLEESILNAWKHGRGHELKDPIAVRWHLHNDFVLEVLDHGDGFDPASVPDPRSITRLAATDGRGIFMIKAASDSVRWKAGGRHLVAAFAPPTLPRGCYRADSTCRTPLWRIPGRKDFKSWN